MNNIFDDKNNIKKIKKRKKEKIYMKIK